MEHAISALIPDGPTTVISIAGSDFWLVLKDEIGCRLRSSTNAGVEDFIPFAELQRIDDDGLLRISVEHPYRNEADTPPRPDRLSVATAQSDLLDTFARHYLSAARPTVAHIHRRLAEHVWKVNHNLPEGHEPLRVPSISALRNRIQRACPPAEVAKHRSGRNIWAL